MSHSAPSRHPAAWCAALAIVAVAVAMAVADQPEQAPPLADRDAWLGIMGMLADDGGAGRRGPPPGPPPGPPHVMRHFDEIIARLAKIEEKLGIDDPVREGPRPEHGPPRGPRAGRSPGMQRLEIPEEMRRRMEQRMREGLRPDDGSGPRQPRPAWPDGMGRGPEEMRRRMEEARTRFREMQERIERLEAEIARLKGGQ